MNLYHKLLQAKTEEDVKDAYIKALGLKSYSKNLIDIQTKEIWFEAKDGYKHSTYQMFTQLLHYVQQAFNNGEEVPPFLCVIDTKKAAIMKTADVLPLLTNSQKTLKVSNKKSNENLQGLNTIKWGKNASGYTQEALDVVSAYIGTYLVSFKIETHEDEFIQTIKNAIKSGDIIRTQITPDNLKQVFDKWVTMVGKEIKGVAAEEYALLFFADIMSDGNVSTHDNLPAELLHKNNQPVFMLAGKIYELGSREGYRQFWAIYHRPPKQEYRNYLLERRDSLIPIDERSFKGAYYTPLAVVDKAYDKLTETLGKNWQKDYIVWDMCCGVGNLEVKHSNPRNIFMSTLDVADVDVMKATKTCVAATRFQYDYLNDDITNDGKIDYTLTNKIPAALQQAIKDGKKILVLINPPYGEAGSSDTFSGGKHKKDIAKTKLAAIAFEKYGKASNELYTQFITRISIEIPTATIAMFSTMKYVIAPTLDIFRNNWNAKYLGGFVVHSKAFDGLKGEFPIGFLVWKTNNNQQTLKVFRNLQGLAAAEIITDVLDKNANPIGEKTFYNIPNKQLLTNWIERPKTNKQEVIPLKNTITTATATKDLRGTKWSDNAIAFLWSKSNDIQHANQTAFFSSGFGDGHGIFVNEENLWQAAIIFAVRRLVKPTWLNDRDQFLQPNIDLTTFEKLSNLDDQQKQRIRDFKTDCLIWMLFNGSNLTASANNLEWNNKKWSIVNHFIPFTEEEVGSPERFESDFMVRYLQQTLYRVLNPIKVGEKDEANNVLAEGKKLWQAYFAQIDVHTVREELKLNRSDVGWYQIRKALQARNSSGDYTPVNFKPFEEAYKALTEKLQPMVYELGFLKN